MIPGSAAGAAYLLDKSKGITSRRAASAVADAWGINRFGHTGTLDPDATGLLIVLLGKATRLASYVSSATKRYRFSMILGIRTDTDDTSGEIIMKNDAKHIDGNMLTSVLNSFTGYFEQRVPDYSAVRIGGKRAYTIARSGESVVMPSRKVCAEDWEFHGLNDCTADLSVTVSSGTYIRGLARDIGEKLGTGGVTSDIRRTRIGGFSVDEGSPEMNSTDALLTMADIMRDYESESIIESDAVDVSHGRRISGRIKGTVSLLDSNGVLLAVATGDGISYQPVTVLDGKK